jgi:ribosome-binding protein aMBF1 (putative translation factor)
MAKVMIFLLVALFGAAPVLGEHPAERVKKTVTGTVDIRKDTQRQEDRWAVEKAELEAQYRASRAHIQSLEKQTDLWRRKVDVLQEQVDELNRRIEESELLDTNLHEILEEVMNRLKGWVEKDLPFLPQERADRLAFLEETLAQTDISGAEKLRHLLEVLLVECEYGDTVEVYEESIEVDGESVFARVFRLGRLSIFWQTPDGERVGEYDRVTNGWVELPEKYARSISAAVEMAEKRRPIELLRLPVGRISP